MERLLRIWRDLPDFPKPRPSAFPARPSAAADVVVIGGGVIGVMTAWNPAEQGVRVVLCEKGRIAGEQSSRNWGWVRQQGRDLAELPIMMEANRIWKAWPSRWARGLGFRQEGVIYLARTEKEMAQHEAYCRRPALRRRYPASVGGRDGGHDPRRRHRPGGGRC